MRAAWGGQIGMRMRQLQVQAADEQIIGFWLDGTPNKIQVGELGSFCSDVNNLGQRRCFSILDSLDDPVDVLKSIDHKIRHDCMYGVRLCNADLFRCGRGCHIID